MARFAVCIPVYNGAAFVGQALESIASQSHGDLEVIVSDNASSDGTPEILASWSDRLPMRIIRREQTLPMRDHFNALLDEVDSDVCAPGRLVMLDGETGLHVARSVERGPPVAHAALA